MKRHKYLLVVVLILYRIAQIAYAEQSDQMCYFKRNRVIQIRNQEARTAVKTHFVVKTFLKKCLILVRIGTLPLIWTNLGNSLDVLYKAPKLSIIDADYLQKFFYIDTDYVNYCFTIDAEYRLIPRIIDADYYILSVVCF